MSTPVLIIPGWHNSGPDHWQSLWQAKHGYVRVEQHNWDFPLRGDWMIQLEEAVLAKPDAVLVAHSLGCVLVVVSDLGVGMGQNWVAMSWYSWMIVMTCAEA